MSGYYSDAVLKFRLTFPRNYPERPPVVQFVTDVFHPLVAQDGIFNLAPRFRPWRYEQRKVRVYRGLTLSQTKGTSCVRCLVLGEGYFQEECARWSGGRRLPEQGSLQVSISYVK